MGVARHSRVELASPRPACCPRRSRPTFPATLRKQGRRVKKRGWANGCRNSTQGSDFFSERIVEGRWIQPNDDLAIVVTYDTANKNNIRVGDLITLDLGVFLESAIGAWWAFISP